VASLLGDGWFYISAVGFIGSGALFLYLLGQYRVAVEDAEESEAVAPAPALTVKPVVVDPTPAMAPVPIVSQPQAKPVTAASLPTASATPVGSPAPDPRKGGLPAAAAPAQGGGYTGPDRRRGDLTASGSLSPAVVYLQNIKSQMEKFDKEISALKSLSVQQAAQGELLLKRLSELAENIKTAPAPHAALPAPAQPIELSLETAVQGSPAKEPIELKPAKAVEPAKRAKAVVEAASGAAPTSKPRAVLPAEKKAEAPSVEKSDRAVSGALPEPAQKEGPAAEPAAVIIESLPQTAAVFAPAPAEAAPAAAAPPQEPADQPSQPRKGPVWPV
jgi:hypothetical protein